MSRPVTGRWIGFTVVLAVAVAAPFVMPHPFALNLMIQALIWALLAASWDLLSGYTGQISFGHAGFFVIGAYVGAGLAHHLHVSPWLALLAAPLATAVMGFAVGIPALRLRGHYLALVTLGFAEIVRLIATNWLPVTGGPFGMHDFGQLPGLPAEPTARSQAIYLIYLALVAASVAFMLVLCEQRDAGRAFRAVREDQILAESHGIDIRFYKLLAFVLSAGLAGLAGALYAFYVGLVAPTLASPVTSALIIGMAVFGGLGTIWGPVLGAVLLFLIGEGLRFVGVVYNLIAVGLVIMVFVIFLPRGLAGLAAGRRGVAGR